MKNPLNLWLPRKMLSQDLTNTEAIFDDRFNPSVSCCAKKMEFFYVSVGIDLWHFFLTAVFSVRVVLLAIKCFTVLFAKNKINKQEKLFNAHLWASIKRLTLSIIFYDFLLLQKIMKKSLLEEPAICRFFTSFKSQHVTIHTNFQRDINKFQTTIHNLSP